MLFQYLHGAKDVSETIRDLLQSWWAAGETFPLWCTETGISSDQNPESMDEWRMEGGGVDPTQWYRYFEVRVDPRAILEGPRGGDPFGWPRWVFTSETEQARQVWTRLSYLAGLGVEKVLWYTNEDDPLRQEDTYQDFFSYGVTSDRVAETATAYRERGKKLAFCALRRWNELLDRYQDAAVLPSSDGQQGFYGVVFRRGAGSARADEYPFAVVAWADGRAYTSVSAGGMEEPPPCDGGGRWMSFRYRDCWHTPPVLRVAAVPRRVWMGLPCGGTDAGCGVVNPCVEGRGGVELGDPEVHYDPSSGLLMFADDEEVPLEGIVSPRATGWIRTDEDPLVWLLPDGLLTWQDGEGGWGTWDLGAMEQIPNAAPDPTGMDCDPGGGRRESGL